MSDKFQPIAAEPFAAWVFEELERQDSIFGIPRRLFFVPGRGDPFASSVYGHRLETPFGVAAGPHSQMAQNIVVAWLCGARFIELKTVQTLDELEVSKPCIDMQDEGYNVEWSQELRVHESIEEYARAWVLIHALHRQLGFPGDAPGVVFNLSVGYNMEGLLKPNMQGYLRTMLDAREAVGRHIEAVAKRFPGVRRLTIPSKISDNVTLSTMHGCPPDEIEKISAYLVEEWGFHTNVKCNPTLLGPEALRRILNEDLGYRDVVVPDLAFGHDLKYDAAVPMLRRLQAVAAKRGVHFGVKLSNTLEVENTRDAFSKKEKMMYLSGRALHAVTVNLAAKLSAEFRGALPMSFAGGADAFTAADLFRGGMKTVTVCSDILKPGGYLRILQYVENLAAAMARDGAKSLDEFGRDGAAFLARYAGAVRKERRLAKDFVDASRTKTSRPLGLFDCIKAPCTDECPVDQKVPEYMRLVRQGRFDEAVEVTRQDNPLPSILGRACNHLCQNLCIRTHYDQPLAIREMKRFIMDRERTPHFRKKGPPRDARVAVVGGGPCGLSAAYFLRQAGFPVTVFEARAYAGGMVAGTIPAYRASQAVVDRDLEVVRELGVEIRYGQAAGRDFTLADLRKQGFKYIVLGVGAQRGKKMGVEGEDAEGVLDALEFLRSVKEKRPLAIGKRVGVIGGGDVAMDCARSAWRLGGGAVGIIYRRTVGEMPAAREEIEGVLAEGIQVTELAKPLRVVVEGGKVAGLECLRMKLGDKDASGRRRPVDVPGSEFVIPLDTLIVAVSQEPALEFLAGEKIDREKNGYIKADAGTLETSVPGLFAGGDVAQGGPESIVKALGDGRTIAEAIAAKEGAEPRRQSAAAATEDLTDLIRRKARRQFGVAVPELPAPEHKSFKEVVLTLSESAAKEEAGRCLDCDLYCSLCVSVCPNKAFFTYRAKPMEIPLAGGGVFRVRQGLQVAVLTDFCNECGNCATFCPTAGKPYRDKPRLYLRKSEFEAESDNAFMVSRRDGTWCLQGRFGGETHELAIGKDVVYSAPTLRTRIDPKTWSPAPPEPCAVMFALLEGLRGSMSHLPF